MAARKINLNELRRLVRQVMSESVVDDSEIDAIFSITGYQNFNNAIIKKSEDLEAQHGTKAKDEFLEKVCEKLMYLADRKNVPVSDIWRELHRLCSDDRILEKLFDHLESEYYPREIAYKAKDVKGFMKKIANARGLSPEQADDYFD